MRNFGVVQAAIWRDRDFLSLPVGPQRLYLFLLSQPDLNHAGLVPLRARRWVGKCADYTVEELLGDLKALHHARFVVVDERTEEVLIRTYVRNDKVYAQPKVMVRMGADVIDMESPRLRAVFLDEMGSLPLERVSPDVRKVADEVVAELRDAWENHAAPTLFDDFIETSTDTPTDTPGNTPGDTPRGGSRRGTQKGTGGVSGRPLRARAAVPQPPSPSPLRPTAAQSQTAARDGPTAQTLVGEYVDRCAKRPPSRVIGQLGKQLAQLIDDGIDPADIRRGLTVWADKGLHPSTLASVVNEAMNARRGSGSGGKGDPGMWDRAMERAMREEGAR